MNNDIDVVTRILIVEDQEIVRTGLTMMLSKMDGVEVVGEASNGQMALRMCQTVKPDVVLMDLAMPVMNGIEATKEIKQAHPHIRVVMLTTHDTEQDIFAALSAGADGYSLKTIGKQDLGVAIKAVASGAAWLHPSIANQVLRAVTVEAKSVPQKAEPLKWALSPREIEVLKLLVEGLSNQEMAQSLHVSNDTIKSHMRHIMEKLAVSDRTQAAIKALKSGLV